MLRVGTSAFTRYAFRNSETVSLSGETSFSTGGKVSTTSLNALDVLISKDDKGRGV